jgi:flavin-dependent dehydrogenase
METYDVVVVGAGLAGLHAARAAARRGLKVLLLDRKARIDASIHTTGIFVRRTLDDFALPEHGLGPPVRCVRLLGPSLAGLTLRTPHDAFRVGRMARLYADLLEDARSAGAEARLGTRYVGSEAEGGTTRVLIATGARSTSVRARYLLGADGAASRVAADLALDENSRWIVGVEDVYAARRTNREARFTCVVDPVVAPGYLAWAVNDGDEIHVGVGGYADRFEPREALAAFTKRITRIEPLHGAVRLERRGGLIPVGGVHRRIANRRGALLGDAAGAPSPLTAGGLDPCLRLSEAAVEACLRHLGGDPEALAALDGKRFRARFATRLFMRRALDAVRHRPVAEGLILALRVPPLRQLAAHIFFGRGSFPEDRYPSRFNAARRASPRWLPKPLPGSDAGTGG